MKRTFLFVVYMYEILHNIWNCITNTQNAVIFLLAIPGKNRSELNNILIRFVEFWNLRKERSKL